MKKLLFILFSVSALLSSCSDSGMMLSIDATDSSTDSDSSSEYADTNTAIYQQIAKVYLWRDSIPSISSTNTSLSSSSYFDNYLRYRVNNNVDYYYDTYGDRFSYMEYTADTKSSTAFTGYSLTDWGFEYVIWTNSNGSSVLALQVLYVVPGSPADEAGLKRGDLISKINSSSLTVYNTATLLSVSSPTLTLINGDLDTIGTLQMQYSTFDNTPLIYSAVIEGSSPKTAYFFYNEFKNDSQYTSELQAMFAEFSAAGVENVIIDLRYNPGGYISAAQLIASALTPSQSYLGSTTMYKYQSNASSSNLTPVSYYSASQIGGSDKHVGPSKIAFITTSYTASASELLYISLRPLFSSDDCITVGATTTGKNLASNSYEVDDWTLHPITARIYDKDGVSGYEAGIAADVAADDYDYENLTMADIGDTSERMLAAALSALGVSSSTNISFDSSTPTTRASRTFEAAHPARRNYNSIMIDNQ